MAAVPKGVRFGAGIHILQHSLLIWAKAAHATGTCMCDLSNTCSTILHEDEDCQSASLANEEDIEEALMGLA